MLNCVAALSLREAVRRSIYPFSLVSFFPSCFRSLLDKLAKILERDLKKRKGKKYKTDHSTIITITTTITTIQSIQISTQFSFRVVWFVHAPVTHPILQPSLMVSIVFLFISIIFLFLFFSAYSYCV